MQGEDALDANAKTDLPHVEGCTNSMATVSRDDHSLECLDTFTPTLDNSDINANRVSWLEDRQVVAQLCIFDLFDRVHGILRSETMRCRDEILSRQDPYRSTR